MSATELVCNGVKSKHSSTNEIESPVKKANRSLGLTRDEIINKRREHYGSMCSVFYKNDPINVVRASGQYLFDEKGRQYLDCISNVQHVGHCHSTVAQRIDQQVRQTNCNSRFLHENLVICCEKIKATLPDEIDTLIFCNSGSEANDLALRIAFDYTDGASDIIVIDHAYHGHVSSLIDISPFKFNGPGGRGKPDHVHVAPCPDVYRGLHRLPDEYLQDQVMLEKIGLMYAEEVKKICDQCKADGRRVRAFIMEALQSCGGQIIPPPGYMKHVLKYIHEAGGLFIVDEVQTGFGRIGSNFWAFQLYDSDFVPDIVTMGKPMGNGFPVSALATKRSIAKEFGRGMEYFNTFGGNPVACAAVLGVIQALEEDKLIENSKKVGEYMLLRLKDLKKSHASLIGDVRGVGLFVGIELISNTTTRDPAPKEAASLIQRMRSKGTLLSVEGPCLNVIKIKPPLCFNKQNVDQLVEQLDESIKELNSAETK